MSPSVEQAPPPVACKTRRPVHQLTFVECATCGRTVQCKPREARTKRYCSRSCMAEGYRRRMMGPANPHFKGETKTCRQCGASFRRYAKTANYCCHRCYANSRRKDVKAPRKGRATGSQRARRHGRRCLMCGAVLTSRRKYCAACLHTVKRGIRLGWRKPPELCAPTRTSTCSRCHEVVQRPSRKYCDACWSLVRATQRSGDMWKRDHNHNEIVEALRKVGCSVLDLSAVGGGCPDILVRTAGGRRTVLMEIKNPSAKGKLNKLQETWHKKWGGQGDTLFVVRSIDEALIVVAEDDRE